MQLFSSNFKLGILGGGQLGKMLLYDAKRYDLHTKVMDSNNQSPCAKIADEFIVGDITNYQDVIDFGNKVDIITVEIEKINTEALLELEKKGKKVYPSAKTLQIIQNKSDQKDFYKNNNLPTSGFKNYSNLEIEVDYSKKIKLELINYKKENNIISNIFIKLKKQKNKIEIIKALYKEKKK